MAKEMEIRDNEMYSRYEKIYSANCLYYNFVKPFIVMTESRIMIEYEDYFVCTCTALEGGGIKDMR